MGIIIRQSFKASVVSYIGAFIGYLNIMFITPRCLPPEIVGLSKVFLDLGLFLTFFVQLGLQSAIVRFFSYFKDEKSNNNGFFFFIIILPVLGFLIFGSLYYFLKDWLFDYFHANSKLLTKYLYYVLPLTFVMVYFGIFEIYSTCLLRIVVPKVIREIIIRLLNIIIIVLFFYKIINLDQFIVLTIFIYGIGMLANLWYISKISKISLKPDFSFLNKPLVRQILTYLFFIMIGGIGTNLVSKFDGFMISSSINLINTGIFTIALYITTIIEIPSRSILMISGPIIADAIKNNDINSIKDIYRKTSLNQFIIGGFIFLMVWINVDNIFAIMPRGNIYSGGKYVILFIGISKMFDMITGANGLIISNSKFYYYTLFFLLYLTVVSVGLNLLLIPVFGITGAAIASLAGIGSYNLLLVAFLKIKMNIQPFTIRTLKAIVIILIPFVLNFLIPFRHHPVIDSSIRSTIIIIIYFSLLIGFSVSDDINNIWRNIRNGRFIKDFFSLLRLK